MILLPRVNFGHDLVCPQRSFCSSLPFVPPCWLIMDLRNIVWALYGPGPILESHSITTTPPLSTHPLFQRHQTHPLDSVGSSNHPFILPDSPPHHTSLEFLATSHKPFSIRGSLDQSLRGQVDDDDAVLPTAGPGEVDGGQGGGFVASGFRKWCVCVPFASCLVSQWPTSVRFTQVR